jgi:hypothetical protein
MIVELLADDADALGDASGGNGSGGPDQAAREAFERGLEALGSRPGHDRPVERPATPAGVNELLHLYAAAAAELRLLRFSYEARKEAYDRSAREYGELEEQLLGARRGVVPALRARLAEVRAEEEELERRLRAAGLEPDAIGPRVPAGRALDPTPRPGELPPASRALAPLERRPGLRDRLRRRR